MLVFSFTQWGLHRHPDCLGSIMMRGIHYNNYNWLVVWNMNLMTFHILGIIIPTDFRIFFRGVETTNQIMLFDTHNIIIIESILLIILFGLIIHDDWKGLRWLETTNQLDQRQFAPPVAH